MMAEAWSEWRYPNAIAYVNAYGGNWINEANIYAEDGAFATSNGVDTRYIIGQQYGFDAVLPSDAIILGIEQKLVCKSTIANQSRWAHRRLWPTIWSTKIANSVNNIPDTLTDMTLGGASDTWGYANPPRSQVIKNIFGAACKGRAEGGSMISLDTIAMRIYYSSDSIPSGNPPIMEAGLIAI